MMNKLVNESTSKSNQLSCEQVYNIWATEPSIIKIFDLRSASEFSQAHIPGAENILSTQIMDRMNLLGDQLAVFIVADEIESAVEELLVGRQNYVFMSRCHLWAEQNKPLAGSGVQSIILNSNALSKKLTGDEMKTDIIFHQLFEPETSTYTYIIADKKTKQAAIIDPVLETVERDLKLIAELDLQLMYVLDTHIHADHITGAGEIRKLTKAKTAVGHEAEVSCIDIPLEDGQELLLGNKKITVIATPGHTNTCNSYVFEGLVFTGDALLIRGCGRTDFQQGSSDKLYDSVHKKLFKLPDDTLVYPGHDYRGQTSSTIALEKKFNPRLAETKTKAEFIQLMSELKLEHPKKIHEAVPANLACGVVKTANIFHPQMVDGIPVISCENVYAKLSETVSKKTLLIDVRRPEEFNAELGHVENSRLITLGPDLTKFLKDGDRQQEIVFICRSGNRSGHAALEGIQLGYKHVINMDGGMLRWNQLGQKTITG